MKSDKQKQAYNLYFQTNLSQAEIAKIIDVDRKTIHNWLTDGNWRQLKKSSRHIPSRIVEQLYYMVANITHEVLSRGHDPVPRTYELDALRRLTISIRHLKNRQTINESIESFTELAEIINLKDPELADKLRPHIKDYVHERADFKIIDCVMQDHKCDPKLGELFDYELRPYDDNEPQDPANPSPDDPITPINNDPTLNPISNLTENTPTTPTEEPILVAA